MKILIATGIYPPQIGGPAKYAENLKEEWEKDGHLVRVKTYGIEHSLPPIVRHFYYLFKIIPAVVWSDFVYTLDTFSVGMPAVIIAKIFRKKIILRTGGDFLWESYVERTEDLVLFKDFYESNKNKLSIKEKVIFKLTRFTLQNVSYLIFSTKWQRDIFIKAYDLKTDNIGIVENFYGEKVRGYESEKNAENAENNKNGEVDKKVFVAGTRKLKWKNLEILENLFKNIPEAKLDLANYSPKEFQEKIASSYATILVSLGDISPNMILESIRYNKPFILTEENGLMDRIGSIAITVNPKDEKDIEEKVKWLLDPTNYQMQVRKIENWNFIHSWKEIAKEVVDIYQKIKNDNEINPSK